jgi:hypothetical protein
LSKAYATELRKKFWHTSKGSIRITLNVENHARIA